MSKIEEYEKVNSCDPGDIVLIDGPRGTRIIDATKLGSSPDAKSDAITASASGPVATFSDGADNSPVLSCVAQITPVQAGTGDPSPSNVRAISGFTGCKITRTGKNLLNMAVRPSSTANGITSQIYENNRITISGTSTGNGDARIYVDGGKVLFKANQKYTISFEGTDTRNSYLGIYFHRSDVGGYTTVFIMSENAHSKEFMFTEDTLVDFILLRTNSGFTITLDATVQIEYGSVASSFEPYSGQTVEITFSSDPGTVYGGTLDVTTGELTATDAEIESYNGETLPGEWISDRDVYSEGATPTIGAQVVYKLATPLVYHLTPREVITLLGNNNIFADTGDISLTYAVDTKTYIDDKIAAIVATLSTT